MLAAVLLVILLGAIYYTFFIMGNWRPDTERERPEFSKKECGEGEKIQCIENNCTGERHCEHGAWSACRVEKICEPGSKEFCYSNTCITGYKICDGCGTGYGECISNGKS